MGKVIKIFIITFVTVTLVLLGGVMAFVNGMHEEPIEIVIDDKSSETQNPDTTEQPVKKPKTKLELAVESSERVNILLMGLEGTRTDTMMLASFSPDEKVVDIISIPRDTYYYTKGYERNDLRKINAVYGRGGTKGVMDAVSDILGVPVHDYIKVDYRAVEDIVDTLGGVKVNIPFNMDYDDPWAKPPLSIHFKKGPKLLNGSDALKYLRFRQNNDKSHSTGDIGRVARQQDFIKAAAKKALSISKLPVVAKTTIKHVKTSLDVDDVVRYASLAIGITPEDINTYILPGDAVMKLGLSYYERNDSETEGMMLKIYSAKDSE